MKGYWHLAALSACVSTLTILFDNKGFILGFFLWIFYLFYVERLGKLPLLVSLIIFLFFIFYIPSKEISVDTTIHTTDTVIGNIVSPISMNPQKIEFTLQEKYSSTPFLIVYFPTNQDASIYKKANNLLKHGAVCNIYGEIDLPPESRNPGQFDYRDYLLSKGITHQVIVSHMEDMQCEGASWMNRVYSMRLHVIDYITKTVRPETSAWLNALVLGDDSQLSDDTIELFQRWSLSHILAISGLHVGLIVGLLYFILVKLSFVTKETAQWIVIMFLPLYAFIAGGEPSVWRASIMVLLFIIINKIGLKFSAVDMLSVIFLLLIISDKYIVYHIGFQLSFTVTFGLILTRQLIASLKSKIFQGLYISFVAQMMILPLQISYFYTFQPLSIILNLLVVPYFSLFAIPFLFLLLLFSFLPAFLIEMLDVFFIKIQHMFLFILENVDRFADTPFIIGDFPVFIAVIYYGSFIMLMRHMEMNKLAAASKYGGLVAALIIFITLRPYFSPVGTVTMLDIGQGDAFVIDLPYRKGVFLMDAGASIDFEKMEPTKKVYKNVIKPFLYSQGIHKMDAIFLSHEHIDHIGSVPYLLEDFQVDEIIISNYYEVDDETKKIWENHTSVRRVELDDKIVIGEQLFHVLSPFEKQSINDSSLVLHTTLGGQNWLFTGDMYKNSEKHIVKRFENVQVDVLKVGHHGSNTSTDEQFIKKIEPAYALIPVGVANRYGHPNIEVLEVLEDHTDFIFRTDEDGAVQYRFKKTEGTFYKYLP